MEGISYENVFSCEEDKAKAFDKIAEKYFNKNFGTLSKTDFEVLLFSIYLEKILDKDEENMQSYNDYSLSKALGITQTKVASLKVQKQLKYPYKKFNWKKSFVRICKNAKYYNGYIILNIPDKNLYLEVKNAIENCNGVVDVTLNPSLLKVQPQYFFDLILEVTENDEEKERIRDEIKRNMIDRDLEYLEKKSFGENLKSCSVDAVCDIMADLAHAVGPAAGNLCKFICNLIKNR